MQSNTGRVQKKGRPVFDHRHFDLDGRPRLVERFDTVALAEPLNNRLFDNLLTGRDTRQL